MLRAICRICFFECVRAFFGVGRSDLIGADSTVVITEWDEFRALDLARVKEMLATPILVDLRNIHSTKTMKALGFRYVCVGQRRAADRRSPQPTRRLRRHSGATRDGIGDRLERYTRR